MNNLKDFYEIVSIKSEILSGNPRSEWMNINETPGIIDINIRNCICN